MILRNCHSEMFLMKYIGKFFQLLLSLAIFVTVIDVAVAADISTAMVTDIEGSVSIDQNNQQTSIALLDNLKTGTQLRLNQGARVVVVFEKNAREFELIGPGNFVIDDSAPRALKGKSPLPRPLPVVFRQLQTASKPFAQATLIMRGDNTAKPNLLSPVGASSDMLPVFRWAPVSGSTGYHFQLVDQTGTVIYASESRDISLVLPSTQKLIAGQSYTWIIQADSEDGHSLVNSTEFTVLDRQTRRRLDAVKSMLENSSAENAGYIFSHRVLYINLLEQADLHEQALSEWRMLMAQRKDQTSTEIK